MAQVAPDKKECLLCSYSLEQRKYFAIIPCSCSHLAICAICAIRLRIFEKHRLCPFCKADWKVFLVTSINYDCPYNQIDMKDKIFDTSIDVFFENESDFAFFKRIRSNHCVICNMKSGDASDLGSLFALAHHLKFKHGRYFCEVCAGNQKIFPFEFDLFNQFELRKHKESGFAKAKGRGRAEPHPVCRFCREACFDLDALHSHLEHKHVMCQFCRARGRHVYEADREGIREHFRRRHFLCEAPECVAGQFAAFDNELDLKDHFIRFHGKDLTPSQLKESRNITQIAMRNNAPTQFTQNRQKTRDAYFPPPDQLAPPSETLNLRDLERFPALPSAPVPNARNKPPKWEKQTLSDRVSGRPPPFEFPPLPTSTSNAHLKKAAPPQSGNAAVSERRTPKNRSDAVLDRLIEGRDKKSGPKSGGSAVVNKKKENEQSRWETIFVKGMDMPAAFDYDELPMRHANLHKRLKELGTAKKFEKFGALYFKFTMENMPADQFCRGLVQLYGLNQPCVVSLHDIIRLVTNKKKSSELFNVCVSIDFGGIK